MPPRPHRRRVTWRALAAAAIGASTAFASSQQPAPQPPEPATQSLFNALKERSQAEGAWAERISIEILSRDAEGAPTRQREEFRVRVANVASNRQLLLELDDLRIHAVTDGVRSTLTAWHTANASSCFVREFDVPLSMPRLREVIPPLLAPSLDVAFDQPMLASILPNIAWDDTPEPTRLRDRVRVRGDAARAGDDPISVMLIIDTDESRVRAAEIVIPLPPMRIVGPAPAVAPPTSQVIRANCIRIRPGDPEQWGIDIADRRRVSGLHELRAEAIGFSVGDPAPNLTFQRLEGGLWTPGFRELAGGEPDRRARAIIMFRARDLDRDHGLVRAMTMDLAREFDRVPAVVRDADRPRAHAACIYELDEFDQSAFMRADQRIYDGLDARPEHLGETLATTAGDQLLDRFWRDGDIVLVAFDKRGVIRRIDEISSETDTEALAREMRLLLQDP